MSEAFPINKRRDVAGPPEDAFPITWDEVARSHGRKIFNYAYRLCGNPHDANDLVQEVLLRVRTGLADYQPGSFEGWLWRITRNVFLDDIRRKRRRPTVSLPDEGDLGFYGRYTAPSPDEVLASVSFDDDIQKALLDLPFDFREAVVMCDVIGLSYDEIGVAVGVPVGTVRSRIHRGRRLLRERLT